MVVNGQRPRKRPKLKPDERARFERWLATYCGVPVEIIREDWLCGGGYGDVAYDLAWAAWCARATQ